MLLTGVGITSTLQIAVTLPLVAEISTSPNAKAVTFPFSSTLAIVGLLLLQVISLYVALSGSMAAAIFSLCPTINLKAVGSRVIFSTGIGSTVTLHTPDTPPEVAVISTSPSRKGVTSPVSDTVAIDSSDDAQVMLLSVAFSGNAVATIVNPSPIMTDFSLGFISTSVTRVGTTLTLQIAVTAPEVTLISTSPSAKAVT